MGEDNPPVSRQSDRLSATTTTTKWTPVTQYHCKSTTHPQSIHIGCSSNKVTCHGLRAFPFHSFIRRPPQILLSVVQCGPVAGLENTSLAKLQILAVLVILSGPAVILGNRLCSVAVVVIAISAIPWCRLPAAAATNLPPWLPPSSVQLLFAMYQVAGKFQAAE